VRSEPVARQDTTSAQPGYRLLGDRGAPREQGDPGDLVQPRPLHLQERQARAELKQVNRELKRLRAQVAALDEKRSVLLAELGEQDPGKPG
jgi:hypothetical protein